MLLAKLEWAAGRFWLNINSNPSSFRFTQGQTAGGAAWHRLGICWEGQVGSSSNDIQSIVMIISILIIIIIIIIMINN